MPQICIAIANHKGGVGKTTTAVNLAAALAERGKRVLLGDLDPQGNASSHVGLKVPDHQHTPIARVLIGMNTVRDVAASTNFGFSLLAGGKRTAAAIALLDSQPEYKACLREALSAVRDEWDVVLLDCPPTHGALIQAALRASDRVIVPLELEPLAFEGLCTLAVTIQAEREHNPDLTFAAWFVTRPDMRLVLSREVLAQAEAQYPELRLQTAIRQNVRLTEAPAWGKPVLMHDATCPGAQDYRALAEELITRGIL